jgi:hypothetical protein
MGELRLDHVAIASDWERSNAFYGTCWAIYRSVVERPG